MNRVSLLGEVTPIFLMGILESFVHKHVTIALMIRSAEGYTIICSLLLVYEYELCITDVSN